ncbi:S41 family peptidase [Desulfonema magnum]|uniref:Peptidase, S41 family n=1 Tax=Desulfonema magnum TaxID=45655 RepID=A0A975BWG6_9BACT|nr:S41 family peptidase [Desulfonema magnum]QTA92933.1 Peptidase, S41 family [Desulfonema magnum]
MVRKKRQHFRLWLVVGIAVLFCTVGSGFYRDLSADDETYKGLKIFSDVIELVEKNYVDPVDTKELIQKAVQGMVSSLDPHSQLLPPEAFEELQIDTKGEFGGIGIVITMQKGVLTVISPIEGTPAYKAGVQAGDIIIKVDGESTKDMMLWEAVKKMRGPEGEPVTITIVRKGEAKPIDFNLIRDNIPIESVKHLVLKPGYGYVRITNFQENTAEDLKAALDKLESGNTPLKGLILDLRDNPGGLLNQAIRVSDLFLEKGTIVSIKGRLKKHTKVFKARRDRHKRNYPIVTLINGGSASASEIVAGALQDHKRAVILGTTSFGKGSVQTVETLRDGYGLKFTIARYYTPNERSIQAQGIEPDIEVKTRFIEEEENGEEEDGLLKEKDLKNHLEAYPEEEETEGTESEPDDKEDGGKKKSKKRKTDYRYGPLNIEGLQEDNQIMRALEILVGYGIFKESRY